MLHMGDRDLYQLAGRVGQGLRAAGWRIATAESCTAGWIAKALTDVPGSSQWFECGYVTYSNAAKQRDLDVFERTLQQHGAVSEATVREMVTGAWRKSHAEVAVAVSGIAGPDGGTAEKPVGTVWFAVAAPGEVFCEERRFEGDREQVRRQSVAHALSLVQRMLAHRSPSRRLFFALWPDEAMRSALAQATCEAVQGSAGQPVPVDNLHLTLLFLGGVAERRVTEVADAAHRARMWHRGIALEMRLDHLEHWPRPRVLCALPAQPPSAAGMLAQVLQDQLTAAGFSPDIKPFRPHVTVARKVTRPGSLRMRPVDWRCNAFALIESRTLESGAVYSVVENYPL